MAETPYRRPGAPQAEKPRGVVVRRADGPEELDAAEQRRTDARFKAQAILAQAELEEARRAADRRTRVAGGALVVLALFLCATTVSSLEEGYYHERTVLLAPAFLFAGLFSLAAGTGGATTIQDAPLWIKAGNAVAFVAGLAWGATGFLDVLASFAG